MIQFRSDCIVQYTNVTVEHDTRSGGYRIFRRILGFICPRKIDNYLNMPITSIKQININNVGTKMQSIYNMLLEIHIVG